MNIDTCFESMLQSLLAGDYAQAEEIALAINAHATGFDRAVALAVMDLCSEML